MCDSDFVEAVIILSDLEEGRRDKDRNTITDAEVIAMKIYLIDAELGSYDINMSF